MIIAETKPNRILHQTLGYKQKHYLILLSKKEVVGEKKKEMEDEMITSHPKNK